MPGIGEPKAGGGSFLEDVFLEDVVDFVVDTARELLKYTLWADRRVLAALGEVRDEDLVRPAGASFSSLLRTLAHILGAERVWLSRFVGQAIDPFPAEDDYPDRASLVAGFEELWPQLEFFLAALTDAQLRSSFEWTNSRGETHRRQVWQAVLHVCNHSSYHRGQAVSLLRQLGYEPPSTDLIYFWSDP